MGALGHELFSALGLKRNLIEGVFILCISIAKSSISGRIKRSVGCAP